MKFILLAGRILFSLIFINSGVAHFLSGTISYATSTGVPMANIAVPLSGILAIAGGLSIALGFKAKVGAWFIVIFLVPISFIMHPFWHLEDPATQQMQMALFMKNISMIGAALMISYFGTGPLSVDKRASRRLERI